MDKARTRRHSSLECLQDVIGVPRERGVVYGVILDATGHYKTNDSIDYVTRLRVVDHSLHPGGRRAFPEVKPFVYVFIYSASVAEAPQIGRVGDVIRLEHFHFSEYDLHPKAVFRQRHSGWDIFDGRKNANNLPIMSSHRERAGLPDLEKKHLRRLRVWAELYFSRRSLYEMYWFKRNIPRKRTSSILHMEDVDLIAKLLAEVSVKKDKQFYQRLAFVDGEQRIFLAELKGLLTGIDKGDVLKLRSIGIISSNGQFKITFSSYSNFMVLQKHFKDAQNLIRETRGVRYNEKQLRNDFLKELHLSKRRREVIGPNTFIYKTSRTEPDPKGSRKNLEIVFPILKNFVYDVSRMGELTSLGAGTRKNKSRLSSAVLRKHAALPVSGLAQILKKMRQMEKRKPKRSAKKKPAAPEFFRVHANIARVEQLDFEENFKVFSPKSGRTWAISSVTSSTIPDDAKIIFYNVFSLKDDSLAKEADPVHSYLITYNENPKYIYDLWRLLPDPLVVKDWLNLDEDRKVRFANCLQRLTNSVKRFDLVLQIVEAEGGKMYLKIVDSIFWIARQGSL